MAISVDFLIPSLPNILIYPYDIRQTSADPQGAEEIASSESSPPVLINGLDGRNSLRCSATQIGPTPGPPPP